MSGLPLGRRCPQEEHRSRCGRGAPGFASCPPHPVPLSTLVSPPRGGLGRGWPCAVLTRGLPSLPWPGLSSPLLSVETLLQDQLFPRTGATPRGHYWSPPVLSTLPAPCPRPAVRWDPGRDKETRGDLRPRLGHLIVTNHTCHKGHQLGGTPALPLPGRVTLGRFCHPTRASPFSLWHSVVDSEAASEGLGTG